MKAITVYEPWAMLVAIEAKKIETRSWATRYRGTLAIHAGKNWPSWAKLLLLRKPFRSVLFSMGLHYPEALPLGAIVAICDLEGCFRIDPGPLLISNQEKAFGDYTPGRFMWMLENVKRVNPPIPAKGKQGIWEWNEKP
jgi:hypothetical protein